MSLPETLQKIKSYREPLYFAAILLLTGSLGFGLGRWSGLAGEREPIQIVRPTPAAPTTQPQSAIKQNYVASVNGAKYYLTSCSAANRIKEENKIYFASVEEARKAGYTPAANCPGL